MMRLFRYLPWFGHLWAGAWIEQPHHGARVARNSSVQSIANGSFVPISFDVANYDEWGYWSAGTPTRLVAVESGIHDIGAQFSIASNVTGKRAITIRLNATTVIATAEITASGTARKLNISTKYNLTAGDYVEVEAWQNSGGALDIDIATASAWIEHRGRRAV